MPATGPPMLEPLRRTQRIQYIPLYGMCQVPYMGIIPNSRCSRFAKAAAQRTTRASRHGELHDRDTGSIDECYSATALARPGWDSGSTSTGTGASYTIFQREPSRAQY